MNVLIVTPSYKPAFVYGGPIISVSELAESLVKIGHRVTIYTTNANGSTELDVPLGVPVDLNGVSIFYFPRITGDHTHISPSLWWHFLRTQGKFEVVHLQSWWNILVMVTALICKLLGKRFVISPRGMLGNYSFGNRHGHIKKWLHRLLGRPLLKGSILHATSLLEWRDCSVVHQQWQGFVLHNLLQLPEQIPPFKKEASPTVTLGFLSRIDHKKGLELLFQALAGVRFSYQLKIAGSGDAAYIQSLKDLSRTLGIDSHIEWCGWMSGFEKFDFLRGIDLLVLPSYNENFAVVVAEALSVGTPVLVSAQVGLADYVLENELGWVCPLSVPGIGKALGEAVAAADVRVSIKEKGPACIKKDFNSLQLARQYAAAYGSF